VVSCKGGGEVVTFIGEAVSAVGTDVALHAGNTLSIAVCKEEARVAFRHLEATVGAVRLCRGQMPE
jgi:hypothetical protein